MSEAVGTRREAEQRPGRTCPVAYRYSPQVFARDPEIVADTIYVIGGLYGNVEALDAIHALAAREPGPVTLVFNGDFHWFDVALPEFERVTREVLQAWAIRGNVETEIADEDHGVGCGCAYPLDVSDAVVSRSNEILARLRGTARAFPELRERLAALPMNLAARVGDARVGIVHGDASSLAGWGFAQDRLDDIAHRRWIEDAFRLAEVDVFASTHTCLPAFRDFSLGQARGVVANNGAAGMPNFTGRRAGLLTRISRAPSIAPERLYGVMVQGAHVEAIEVRYAAARWERRFLASWPAGSAAHDSYFGRLVYGPSFTLLQAAPRAA